MNWYKMVTGSSRSPLSVLSVSVRFIAFKLVINIMYEKAFLYSTITESIFTAWAWRLGVCRISCCFEADQHTR